MISSEKCQHKQQEVKRVDDRMVQKCTLCKEIQAVWYYFSGKLEKDLDTPKSRF